MKLQILGCGDAFGSGGRNQSAYLFDADDRCFLLDCGATTLPALKRAGRDAREIDGIFITHLHGDHFGGIPFLFLEYLYQRPRESPLTIAGPPGTEERVRELFTLFYGGRNGPKPLPPTFFFQTLRPDRPQSVSGVDVFPFRVPHQADDVSLALKIAYRGKQILFSGDSAWTDLFIEHARGVDLFLCECSFYCEQPGMHVNYETLQANLPRLECKQLLLTHLGEEMLARRHQLAATTAEDGMVIEF